MAGPVSELLAGVGLLGRGLGLIVRRPRLFWMGAIPPAITSVLFTAILVLLITRLDRLVGWLTPFTNDWDPGVAAVVRVLVGLALMAGSVLVMVISFTTLTLTLGSPLYDKISEYVDREFPDAPKPLDEPVLRGLGRGLRQSLALITVSAVVAVLLFASGFIPLVGQSAVPVVSAVFGGWMLCIELVGSPLERRGLMSINERRSLMRRYRARVLGFAVPTFLLLAIPFVGVVVFPVATAAGTILARHLVGESTQPVAVVGSDPRPRV